VANLLLVSDASTVLDELSATLDDGENTIRELSSGYLVRQAVSEEQPDLVITDCQVGSMGGIAICMDLKLEESGGRLPYVPVIVLLDRRADVFLARRSGAEGWLVKPLDPLRLRRAVRTVLDGRDFHDESFKPVPSLAGA
jgi:DNA-binding response OmpR family regulator